MIEVKYEWLDKSLAKHYDLLNCLFIIVNLIYILECVTSLNVVNDYNSILYTFLLWIALKFQNS